MFAKTSDNHSSATTARTGAPSAARYLLNLRGPRRDLLNPFPQHRSHCIHVQQLVFPSGRLRRNEERTIRPQITESARVSHSK